MIFLIILIVTFVALIIYLPYLIPKNLGYKKIGLFISIGLLLFVLKLGIYSIYGDQLFTNEDAKELLMENNISLLDDFKIIKNKTYSDLSYFGHRFTIQISKKDNESLISTFKKNKNFKEIGEGYQLDNRKEQKYNGKIVVLFYETVDKYNRFSYISNGTEYIPNYKLISIDKSNLILTYYNCID